MEGSHTLERLINDVARDVVDPESNVSEWKRVQAQRISDGDAGAWSNDDLRIGALGSGSDFTPFLQHLGVASLNLGYGGEDNSGIYHSIYDDFYWYTHFSDTSFVYGRALAQTVGAAVMRLADADVLPFVFTNLASTTKRYIDELQKLRDHRAEQIADVKKRRDDGIYAIAEDPRDPIQAPAEQAPPPHFDFAPLLDAQDSLAAAASRFEKAYDHWSDRSRGAGPEQASASHGEAALRAINEQLLQSERAFLDTAGLKQRAWYRHLLYAPGFYTGYDVKTMPGIREALEQGAWGEVDGEIVRVADALKREASLVGGASRKLDQVGTPMP
jgi:N-acetylated-alpha-linked acidic dipeptidase